MKTNKKDSEPFSSRTKIWGSLVIATMATVVSLISSIITDTSTFIKFKQISFAVIAAVVAIAVSTLFTAVLVRRERGPSRVAKLKNALESSYISALENSEFNPVRGGIR